MTTEIELVDRHQALPAPSEWAVMRQMADAVARTEFVPKGLRGRPDATLAAIMFGREIGLPPMVAMSSVFIIEGHPTLSAPLMLALIRKTGGQLTYSESTKVRAKITAKRPDGEEATVEYTIEEAQAAGLAGKENWKKYPADMLWARCVSRLYRRLFSDAAFGATIYAPEDFDQRDAEADSVFTDEQIADMGVMQGLTDYLPRPEDGKPMGDLVKKELLGKVMREHNLPPWKECTPAQHEEAINLAGELLKQVNETLQIEWASGDPYSITFDQAQAILNLVRDGTMPEVLEPDEVIPPTDDPDAAPMHAQTVQTIEQEPPSPVDEALTEQRWSDLSKLLAEDFGQGTNADIEARVRKLYRLMAELGLWEPDQLHNDLAKVGHAHWADLGRKANYQTFARGARTIAQQRYLAHE